jgi:hypothetical protein
LRIELGDSRYRFLHAMLDVGSGRLGLRVDLDQVVDGPHARQLIDQARHGVSLTFRLDLTVQNDAAAVDPRSDRVGDLRSPALENRDLLGDLIVGSLVQRGAMTSIASATARPRGRARLR